MIIPCPGAESCKCCWGVWKAAPCLPAVDWHRAHGECPAIEGTPVLSLSFASLVSPATPQTALSPSTLYIASPNTARVCWAGFGNLMICRLVNREQFTAITTAHAVAQDSHPCFAFLPLAHTSLFNAQACCGRSGKNSSFIRITKEGITFIIWCNFCTMQVQPLLNLRDVSEWRLSRNFIELDAAPLLEAMQPATARAELLTSQQKCQLFCLCGKNSAIYRNVLATDLHKSLV